MDTKSSAPPGNEPPPPYYNNGQQAPIGFAQPPYPQQQPQQTVYVQQPSSQSTVHVIQPAQQTATVIMPPVGAGTCPACRAGILSSEFTCCGICLGIFFFPLGMVCCFLMMERRCSNCRAVYG